MALFPQASEPAARAAPRVTLTGSCCLTLDQQKLTIPPDRHATFEHFLAAIYVSSGYLYWRLKNVVQHMAPTEAIAVALLLKKVKRKLEALFYMFGGNQPAAL